MKRSLCLSLLACSVLLGCGEEKSDTSKTLARPVTTFDLKTESPPPGNLIPGVVKAYRQTEIPFQVPGRVVSLIEIGDEVLGEQTDREGTVVQVGTVLAELDPAPFQRALNRAEQRLRSARLELDAQVVQLETVLPARMDSARAQASAAELNASYARDEVESMVSAVDLARTTLERNRELLPTGAVSDIVVRQSETDLQAQQSRLAQARTLVTTREREQDSALAAIAEIEGSISLQRASNEAQLAGIRELEEAVKDAQSDLDHCVLRAPYPGRVTQIHVGEGSFVAAGAPITTLTMMNPVEVVLTVSAAVEDQLVLGTDAVIYPMNGNTTDFDRGVRATLYNKRGIASSSTRTFEVGLIAPNERRVARTDFVGLPRAPYVIPIFENPMALAGGEGLFTIAEAVHEESGDPWVLKVRGLSQGARTAETLQGVLQAKRVNVRLGERAIRVASFSLIEIMDSDELGPGDLLIPMPTPEHESGFIVDDNRWLLRPGDLVQVSVDHNVLPEGFYLPVQAIRERNGETHVFVVDDSERARAVSVALHESSGDLRRVTSPELTVGTSLVSQGAHFLRDGDSVIRSKEGQ